MPEKRERVANAVGAIAVLLILMTVLLGLVWFVDWQIITSIAILLLGVGIAATIIAEVSRK